MVSLDQLAALDLQLWLMGSSSAARLERTNQSTIVRRGQAVEACFRVAMRRDPDGWRLSGDTRLLQMERLLHQRARLLGHRSLRLHAPFWTLRGRLQRLPQGWCVNPATSLAVCENPIELLRARVIDAALVTPTQMPACSEGLVVHDLHRSRILLTLFGRRQPPDPAPALPLLQERGDLVLRQPSFLPLSCQQRCREWFAQLLPAAAAAAEAAAAGASEGSGDGTAALSVAFLTPEMQQVQGLPYVVARSAEAHPYVERLVLLPDLAEQRPLQALLRHLTGIFTARPASGPTAPEPPELLLRRV